MNENQIRKLMIAQLMAVQLPDFLKSTPSEAEFISRVSNMAEIASSMATVISKTVDEAEQGV